jgi:hypothetical protein
MLMLMNERVRAEEELGVGALNMTIYVKGRSEARKRGKACRLIPNLLPFEAGTGLSAFEAQCQVTFQAPCNLQITPVAMRYSSRKGRKLLREVYPVLLPSYAIAQQKNDRYYVFPFTDDGLEEYRYALADTLLSDGRRCYRIDFEPKLPHHVLMEGSVMVDAETNHIQYIRCMGRIDFGRFAMKLEFREYEGRFVPVHSTILIDYNYAGSTGRNTYDCTYTINKLISKEDLAISRRHQRDQKGFDHHDLTEVYTATPLTSYDWDSIRPRPLLESEAKIYETLPPPRSDKHKRALYQALPERLMTSSNINAFGTDLKVSGPLDPASLSYDKINGVSFRERIRWSHAFRSGQSLIIRPEIGYNFGVGEVRYSMTSEWIYYPERRCGLQLVSRNRNSGFSSRFIGIVNDALDSLKSIVGNTSFDDLGIDYYHHYEAHLEQSLEITNGLMGYIGIAHNYRTPVKHGSRALSRDRLDALVRSHYSDFSPYIRLEWTPHQYYHYQGRQKLYITSAYPKFAWEWAQGVNGVFGSTGRYGRTEVDVQQEIRLTPNRTLSYHVGAGFLYNQSAEYFVNYRYFASNQYPESWNDQIGGVFHLLNDYWYSSSPSYAQIHTMYESPFMLLHHLKRIAKYSIKERVYLSLLYAENKNAYTEMGYGMGNNYFNIGGFLGMKGFQFLGVGIRATIAIDQHW